MAIADGVNPDDPAFVRFPGAEPFGICWRDKYADKARAAITALMEPTEEMLMASWTQTVACTPQERMMAELGDAQAVHLAKMKRRFRAMLKAALEGE